MSMQAIMSALGNPAGTPPAPGMAGGGPSGEEQAVWDIFPGTDPNVVGQLQSSSGDPQDFLSSLFSLQEHDRQVLEAKHQQVIAGMMSALAQPQGAPQGPQAPPPPGVGGENVGGTG